MNLAWYGHLKFKKSALVIAILASLGIALFEYVFQVPGKSTRLFGMDRAAIEDHAGMHHPRGFTVVAFALFRSPVKWNYLVSYAFIVGAVFFAFEF